MRRLKPEPLDGKQFGYWTVAKRVPTGKRFTEYECICCCGTVRVVPAGNLTQGKSKSCGCMKSSIMSAKMTRHGMGGTKHIKVYAAWSSMMTRCFNERSKSWSNYGGRGITVCDRWQSFENFLADMGEPEPHQSLDRIDFNGNYEPGNCRWADAKTQTRNRRTARLTEELVDAMRGGHIAPLEVVAMTGCAKSTAYAARRGQNWRE
jgi:hypothetical protein